MGSTGLFQAEPGGETGRADGELLVGGGPVPDIDGLLLVDWVRFPVRKWPFPNSPPSILKMNALAVNLQSSVEIEEVAYNVNCDLVQQKLTDEEVKEALGVSKVVYSVSNGQLATILPALLDKLNPTSTLVAVWNRERFVHELQWHLLRTLGHVEEQTARGAFSKMLFVDELIAMEKPEFASMELSEMKRALDLELEGSSVLHSQLAILRKVYPNLASTLNDDKILPAVETMFVPDGRRSVSPSEAAEVSDSPSAFSRPSLKETQASDSTLSRARMDALSQIESGTRDPEDVAGMSLVERRYGYVLRLRGLPWETTIGDIECFLSSVRGPSDPLVEDQCVIMTSQQGRCIGEAFVALATAEMRDRCIANLHGNLLGRRWIELFKSNHAEMREARKRKQRFQSEEEIESRLVLAVPSSCELGGYSGSSMMASNGGVLRLRGLPWGSSEYDIIHFFADGGFSLSIHQIAMPFSRGARASGEAWVDLGSPVRAQDARRQLHRKCIGSRYIEIFSSTPKEFYQASKGMPVGGSFPSSYDEEKCMLAPYRRLAGTTHRVHSPYENSPYEDHSSFKGLTSPGGRAVFPIRSSSDPRVHGMYGVGTGLSLGSEIDDLNCSGYGGPPPDSLATQLSCKRESENWMQASASSNLYHFTVLRMRGLPYGSDETHIVQFFNGFTMTKILPTTMPIDGRPSGEAYAEFISAEEAMRAYQMKQNGRIEHRYIELFPASEQEMKLAASGLDAREIKAQLGRTGGSLSLQRSSLY